jgi:hypothetical protein
MVVVNLFGLKQTNGMYFYALDYMKHIDEIDKVIVNKHLYSKLQSSERCRYKCCNFFEMLIELVSCIFKGKFIYTPTSHPIPFYNKQLVIIHDIYPFQHGRLAKIKKVLFDFGVFTSRSSVGYINKSEVLPYIKKNKCVSGETLFLPNLIPEVDNIIFSPKMKKCGEIAIGLIGSDSNKKNYHLLCQKLLDHGCEKNLKLIIYGHSNYYTDSLISSFPSVDINVIQSDSQSLSKFFSLLDVVVSVAEGEGFGRPLSSAIAVGIPCYLISNPINNEFFSSVHPSGNVDDIVLRLKKDIEKESIYDFSVEKDEFINSNVNNFNIAVSTLKRRIAL